MLQVLRLPRKRSLMRCFKCCASHAKRGSSYSQFASLVAGLLPTSRKVLEVLRLPRKNEPASAAPATQNEPEVLQVLRLLCKTRRRPFASLVARFPPTSNYEGAPNAAPPSTAPATQNEPEVLQGLRLPRKTRQRPFASLVAGLPPTSMKVQVLRLPRKTSLKCSKC